MSNEQLDKLTEVCSVCGTRHLDYHRSKFTHIWQDGEYHPIPYGREVEKQCHTCKDPVYHKEPHWCVDRYPKGFK